MLQIISYWLKTPLPLGQQAFYRCIDKIKASVAELVDALGLEPSGFGRGGSSPSARIFFACLPAGRLFVVGYSWWNIYSWPTKIANRKDILVKVEIEDLSPIKKRLLFEIPRKNYDEVLEKAYAKLKQNTQIKGFRKGKVPRSLLEKYYGPKTIMEAVSEIVDKSYQEAIRQYQIPAVDRPEIKDLNMEALEKGEGLSFKAEVEIQPKVTAENYEKIKVKKNKLEVGAEEMERELQGVQKAFASFVPLAEGTVAEKGHQVTLDFRGTLDGEAFEGGSGEGVPLVLGEGRYLPDFEAGILGHKAGESFTFEVKFPQDYGAEKLKGRTAQFEVELLELKKEELPPIDDELAKDVGKFESLDELKKDIENKLMAHKEKAERGNLFQQVLEHLLKKNNFEVPQVMVERELDAMWQGVTRQLASQRITPEQAGIDPKEYRQKNREEALKRIKGFLLFDSIAQQESIKVEESEIEAKFKEIGEANKVDINNVKSFYQQQNLIPGLYSQILGEKTLDFLLEKAKVSEK